MDLTGGGTAIMLLIAAALWFVYLVPTWVRRREYLATERTATRLQQTMRVLAETSEVPETVRIAATAREAARAERMLRARQRREDAMVARQVRIERAAVQATAAPSAMLLASSTTEALRRRRIRRTRLLASLLMIAATVLGLAQIWLMATTGITLGGWFVLAGTLAGAAVAVAVQRRLDVQSMPRRGAGPAARTTRPSIPSSMYEGAPVRPADPAPWTPVAVPKPLYLSKPVAQSVRPAVRSLPDVTPVAPTASPERPAATVTPMRQDPPAAKRAKSGFAAMGIIDPTDTAAPDLDEVLRRRRSAG